MKLSGILNKLLNRKQISRLDASAREYFLFASTIADGVRTNQLGLVYENKSICYPDIDLITSDPENCKRISEHFTVCINSIKRHSPHAPDFLCFIEKDGIGAIGMIRFAVDLTMRTGIPNITIQESRDVPCERVKVPAKYITGVGQTNQKLLGRKVLLVDDVSTSGEGLMRAVNYIRASGGEVHEIVLYYCSLPNNAFEEFSNHGISIYSMIRPSDIWYMLDQNKTKETSVVPDIFDTKISKLRALFA